MGEERKERLNNYYKMCFELRIEKYKRALLLRMEYSNIQKKIDDKEIELHPEELRVKLEEWLNKYYNMISDYDLYDLSQPDLEIPELEITDDNIKTLKSNLVFIEKDDIDRIQCILNNIDVKNDDIVIEEFLDEIERDIQKNIDDLEKLYGEKMNRQRQSKYNYLPKDLIINDETIEKELKEKVKKKI